MTREEKRVILASSAGTIFEWHDFYLYCALAATIGAQFFSAFPEATRNVFALLAFAAGFLVRPFGALVFGRLGDLVGRKYTFLLTIFIIWAWAALLCSASLSDRIGRKPIILAGYLVAALTYFPVFHMISETANPLLTRAWATVPVKVVADKADCSFQFNPAGTAKFTSACDVAKALLARNYVSYNVEAAPPGTPARIRIGDREFASFDTSTLSGDALRTQTAAFTKGVTDALAAAGYPAADNPEIVRVSGFFDVFRAQPFTLVLLLTFLVVLVAAVYGPIAAALAEFFPTRVRYTAMSLPY